VWLGVIVLAVVVFKLMQPKEPEYQGRKLSEWIADLSGPKHLNSSSELVVKDAKEVFLPYIEERLKNNRYPLAKNQLEIFIFNAQIKTGLGLRQSDAIQWVGCFHALELYGDDSLPVLERLMANDLTSVDAAELLVKLNAIEVLEKNACTEQLLSIRVLAARSLGGVTQRKEDAVRILLPLTYESESRLVTTAIYSLGALTALPKTVVPRLRQLLASTDGYVQIQAVYALKEYGTNAAEAEPELVKILKSTNDSLIRSATRDALGKVAPRLSL